MCSELIGIMEILCFCKVQLLIQFSISWKIHTKILHLLQHCYWPSSSLIDGYFLLCPFSCPHPAALRLTPWVTYSLSDFFSWFLLGPRQRSWAWTTTALIRQRLRPSSLITSQTWPLWTEPPRDALTCCLSGKSIQDEKKKHISFQYIELRFFFSCQFSVNMKRMFLSDFENDRKLLVV